MSTIDLVRTTAFRLNDAHFGSVFLYRPGERFARAWDDLGRSWRSTGENADLKKLPYGGLATALRVMSGDFVAMERYAGAGRAFLISRRRIGHDELRTAVAAWEARALRAHDAPVSGVLDDLRCEEVSVASHIQRRAGNCPHIPEGWVWSVGVWEVARRLAAQPMRTDGPAIRWRLDSDASLLSWRDRLVAKRGDTGAMHRLMLHLVTVPGVEDPVLSIQSSLVRLTSTWSVKGGVRHAWAELSDEAPILRGRVRTRRDDDGFVTDWDDRAAEVLRGASLDPLPSLASNPTFDGPCRAGYARQPRLCDIGRGVGTWFHECVAHHARGALGDAEPVTLAGGPKFKGWRPARLPLPALGHPERPALRLLAVYAHSATRKRLVEALSHVLRDEAPPEDGALLEGLDGRLQNLPDDVPLRVGPIELRFLAPTDAVRMLLERQRSADITRWADGWLHGHVQEGVRTAALIETNAELVEPWKRDELADPKPTLRGHLARRGVATQFITARSAPKEKKPEEEPEEFDQHAAANAVGDLFRSSAFFLKPFPAFGCAAGTLVVGIYGARLARTTTGRRASYVVNLVAVSLGTRDAWGYTDDGGWVSLDRATTRFLATDQDHSEESAKQRVERAIGQLPARFGEVPKILLFDAFGCRRMWPCLQDRSDGTLEGWMGSHGKAVVRVRTATSELPRPAGNHDWSDELRPATHTDFRLMHLTERTSRSASYVVAGSAVMSTEMGARKSTRFQANPRDLKKDWHSLGVTELHVLEDGPFERDALLRQVAVLCRVAPTWDRTLRWPSPLHLARAVVRDHPHRYFADGEEEEEPDADRQLRLDFGMA
jgi:hypothetical protein